MITLYNVVSEDGFITDGSGSEDFIPDTVWNDFLELCHSNDVIVMGRRTYEAIQGYNQDLIQNFENIPIKKIVVSHNGISNIKSEYKIVSKPEDVLVEGKEILLTSGPSLNLSFYSKGLIDKVIFNTIPVKLGNGLKVFDIGVNLIQETEEQRNGRNIKTFRVIR